MRRSVLILLFSVTILSILLLTACGGGSSSSNKAAKIVISPTSLSLNRGAIAPIGAVAQDSNGATVSVDFTFSSDNTNLADVSTNGQVCAGKWHDTTFVTCDPAAGTGVANITVTIKNTNISATAKVSVHNRLDVLEISSDATSCTSSAGTQQLSAKAYTTDRSVCPTGRCEIPADLLGQVIYVSKDTDIVSIDNTTDIGKVTAGIPGRTFLYGTVSNVNSVPIIFETCPVKSIAIAIKDSSATNFAVDKGATASLTAVVTDSKGTALTAPPINWITAQSFVASVAAGSPALTATATAANPGNTFIQAACTPPSCNRCTPLACSDQTILVYSNLIQGKVNGIANGTVYAASSDSTQLVPIDVSSNTPGTAVTLPRNPDSMVVNPNGTRLVLGSSAGNVMFVDPTSNAVAEGSAAATALGFTRASTTTFLVDPATNKVYDVESGSTSLIGGYTIAPTLKQFDSSPDNVLVDAVNGTATLYGLFASTYNSLNLSTAANDVDILQSGQALYLTSTAANKIEVIAACNGAQVDSQTANAPQLGAALPNGDGAVFVDATDLILLHNAQVSGVCPITLNEARDSVALPLPAGYKASQVLVSPDSTKAIIITDEGLAIVDLTTMTPHAIALTGVTQVFTGGITSDSKTLYIGANDGNVHRVDLTAAVPAEVTPSIAVGLKKSDGSAAVPQLVVVRNKS